MEHYGNYLHTDFLGLPPYFAKATLVSFRLHVKVKTRPQFLSFFRVICSNVNYSQSIPPFPTEIM